MQPFLSAGFTLGDCLMDVTDMSDQPARSQLARRVSLLLVPVLMLFLLPPPAAGAVEWKERTTRYVVLYHPPELSNTAEQLAAMIDPVFEQVAAVHDFTPRRPIAVRLHANVDAYAQTSDLARTPYGEVAQASLQMGELVLSEPRLRNLTPEQIRNYFRRGLSQLMLDDLARGRLPIGFLNGAAQYSENYTPEVEVAARAVDRARRERLLLSWADLNTPERFAAQSEVAAAQSYAVVAFLLDRYGLNTWQRFLAASRSGPDVGAALTQAYGKPMEALESEWQAYLPEYLGGSYRINYFNRYDLNAARTHLLNGRYHEARDELETLARFVGGAGRTAKENEIREVARQVEAGLEGESFLIQGRMQMASFEYTTARETFQQARARFESIGASTKVNEADQAIAGAESGVSALVQLTDAQRLLADLKYGEARTAALAASQAFATLGDEEHYRQSYAILQSLNTTQTYIAIGLAVLGLLNVLWAFGRLRGYARRQALPGVLR